MIINRWTDLGNNLWSCSSPLIDELVAEDFDMLSLIVDDVRANPARFPNFDENDPTVRGAGYINPVVNQQKKRKEI